MDNSAKDYPKCKCKTEVERLQKKLSHSERKVEKFSKYNAELTKELNDLKSELHSLIKSQKTVKEEKECQTDWTYDSPLYHHKIASQDVGDEEMSNKFQPITSEPSNDGSESTSIADILKATAEEAISQSDYIYDEASGLYYDQRSGYYYNPETKLFYDGTTCIYYSYNEATGQYEFHSQVDMSQYEEYYKHQKEKQAKLDRRAARQARREEKETRKARHEERKCQAESNKKVETQVEELTKSFVSQLTLTSRRQHTLEILWRPPCIRAVVKESECLELGELFIVTIDGGVIGSADACTIRLPVNESVAQELCRISYNETDRSYYLTELDANQDTSINSVPISQIDSSLTVRLSHRDVILVSDTEFLLHIHPGTDTCDECEPGLVKTKLSQTTSYYADKVKSKEERERERRAQLKSIKQRYGLEKDAYRQQQVTLNPQYEDRAESRRKKHGIDVPNAPDEAPASVDTAISKKNVGHKLLSKMGWKEGEALGKSQAGILEPVTVGVRLNASAGLGSMANRVVSMDEGGHLTQTRRKAEINIKTQKRFQKAKTSDIFNQQDDEEDDGGVSK